MKLNMSNLEIDKKELLNDIKSYQSIKVAAESDGGKIILSALQTDIVSSILALKQYKDLTHVEMIALAAKLTANLSMYTVLTGAEKNEQALRKILKEEFPKKED